MRKKQETEKQVKTKRNQHDTSATPGHFKTNTETANITVPWTKRPHKCVHRPGTNIETRNRRDHWIKCQKTRNTREVHVQATFPISCSGCKICKFVCTKMCYTIIPESTKGCSVQAFISEAFPLWCPSRQFPSMQITRWRPCPASSQLLTPLCRPILQLAYHSTMDDHNTHYANVARTKEHAACFSVEYQQGPSRAFEWTILLPWTSHA